MKRSAGLFATVMILLTGAGHVLAAEGPQPRGTSLFAYEMAKGMTVGAVFGDIPITGPDRLLAAQCAVCDHVEIHKMVDDSGIMRMRPVPFVDIPAGQTVTLSAMGYHLMLMGMTSPLHAGDSLPLTLTFEKAGQRTVTVPVYSRKSHK